MPRTWHCIVTIAPVAASSHHRGEPLRQARSAAAKASADATGMRFGFQMNVDSSIPDGETAARSPATAAATGPPIIRASHQVAATAPMPNRAIQPMTATGSGPNTATAGASR